MSRTIPDRYVWAVDLLDVQPDDAILEIGCGYGLAIPLICQKLKSGILVAVDRSAKMATAAAKANSDLIHEDKVEILHADLLDLDRPDAFHKIFLFNINAFWMDPVEELSAIRRLLRPDGKFYIFHLPPPGHELQEFKQEFAKNLESNGFQIVDRFTNDRAEVRSLCIVSRPLNRR